MHVIVHVHIKGNYFWIDNSQQVLASFIYFSTAKCFDFSTLYTSIPYASLKEALTFLIKEAYKIRDIFLIVDNRNKRAY